MGKLMEFPCGNPLMGFASRLFPGPMIDLSVSLLCSPFFFLLTRYLESADCFRPFASVRSVLFAPS